MDAFELQELKTALLDEIQNAFKDKKNPMLVEYEEHDLYLSTSSKVEIYIAPKFPQNLAEGSSNLDLECCVMMLCMGFEPYQFEPES